MGITVLHADAFEDNYIWLVTTNDVDQNPPQRPVAIVDPGDEAPVLQAMESQQLLPVAILCTHHHGDHIGAVEALARRFHIPVYGPATEYIAGMDHPVGNGDVVALPELGLELNVLEVPGHTRGHVAYVGQGMLFCGDTLFSAGCGRLFEGTAAQMHDSLTRLAALPEDTKVYCAHEYTASNLRFALAVDADHAPTRQYADQVQTLVAQRKPSLPSTIGLERRINPFLRTAEPGVHQAAEAHVGATLDSQQEVFAALRRWKDNFRG